MLNLKEMEKTEHGLRVVYTVRHNVAELPTTLEHDLHLLIDPHTGAVTGKLLVDELKADILPLALEKLAVWCDRLAAAIREPMKSTVSIPVFQMDYGMAVAVFDEGEPS